MENYQHRDYLRMIITGLIYHNDYLVSYLKREQKKAENDYIEFSEFIGRTITVVKDLEGEFRRLKDQKKNELEAKKDGENDKSINEQIENLRITEDFSLPLDLYTDGEFKGNIGIWDISKVRDAIHAAFDFYSIENENKNFSLVEYFQENRLEIEAVPGKVSPLRPENASDGKFIHTTWFKVGLTFATGHAQKLYEKYKLEKGHFTKIAIRLGFKETDRPYFSETINNSTVGNKNLYSSPEKLKSIYAYCQVKNITVCPDFIAQLPPK